MKNLRRLALVAGIALSAVAVSPKAQAQTTNVDFEGAIGPACIINSVTNGTLDIQNPSTMLAGVGAVGTAGKINVTCTNGTTFTITSISDNGSVLTDGTYNTGVSEVLASIEDGENFVVSAIVSPNGTAPSNGIGVAGPLQAGPINGKDYELDLMVFRQNFPLSSGYYRVRVGLALTPQ